MDSQKGILRGKRIFPLIGVLEQEYGRKRNSEQAMPAGER